MKKTLKLLLISFICLFSILFLCGCLSNPLLYEERLIDKGYTVEIRESDAMSEYYAYKGDDYVTVKIFDRSDAADEFYNSQKSIYDQQKTKDPFLNVDIYQQGDAVIFGTRQGVEDAK